MEFDLHNAKGENAGKVELPDAIFSRKPRKGFLLEAVTAYLANQREGSANTKTRSEVSGGGRKPWKQKHTGRARAGSNRSPLWRKGGIVHGPRPHSYRQDFSRAKAMTALGQALSAKVQQGSLQIVDKFDVGAPKTREVAGFLAGLKAPSKGVLFVTDSVSENLKAAARNVAGLKLGRAADLHAYDVLSARRLVMTQPGLKVLVGRYAPSKEA